MKPFLNNRGTTHPPQEAEVLNSIYQEIKNTQKFFPSEKLKNILEKFVKNQSEMSSRNINEFRFLTAIHEMRDVS